MLRDRIAQSVVEAQKYATSDEATSIGEHVASLKGLCVDNRIGADHRPWHR
jgi:hypothetical protein